MARVQIYYAVRVKTKSCLSPSLLVNGAFKFKIILMMSSLPSGLQWNHCHRLIGKLLPKIFNFGHLWNL